MKSLRDGMQVRSLSEIPYSRVVLVLAALQVSVGIVVHILWISTGNLSLLRNYFDYQGSIYFIFLDVLTLWLCIVAWRQFRQQGSLRSAWFLISLAMGSKLAGDLLKHWLCVDTYINPLHYAWVNWHSSAAGRLNVWGSAIAGPLFMLILAIGLFKGLQHYKKIHMLGKLRSSDLIWVGGACLYALYVVATVIRVAASEPFIIHAEWVLTWPNDLFLAILLLEAILLMRTAVDMGKGYLARTWGAFAIAIFLTSLESVAKWMLDYNYMSRPEYSIMWYVWFIWAAAFALGPAYQVDAVRHARSRGMSASGPFSNPTAAHALPRS